MDDSITVTATGVAITTSAVSANSLIPLTAGGAKPVYIRVASTTPACVKIGAAAQTATTADLLVSPGDAVVLQVPTGVLNIAAVAVTTGGIVQVSPLENC